MTTLLLATNNQHKRSEFESIFSDHRAHLRVLQPRDLGFSFDVVEDADSFGGNAHRKATGLSALLHGEALAGVSCSVSPQAVPDLLRAQVDGALMVLADDSGICVRALGGRPGIHSARYGQDESSEPLDDTARNRLLLRELNGVPDRNAHYVCNICIILDGERYIQVEETWHGQILNEEQPGSTGFGYDPVVWLPDYDCSVAQLPQEQKDRVSHRAKAARRAIAAALLTT